MCSGYDVIYPEGKAKDPDRFFPIIEYMVNNHVYRITGIENVKIGENEAVTIIYKKNDPANACQFSFFGFWYYGILYSALSCIALTILCYGLFEKHHIIRIPVPFIKHADLPETTKDTKDPGPPKNNRPKKQ